jgi:hypothetical protein
MYCPKCGSNQVEGRRFCTVCGVNLHVVTQALSGNLVPAQNQPPPVPHPFEIEQKRETAKGLRFAIIGGGILAYKLFGLLLSRGSFFGFWTFIAFILLALGVSKLVAYRPTEQRPESGPLPQSPNATPIPPQPLFSSASRTNELPAPPAPTSVPNTEDDTRHFPHHSA